MKGKEIPAMVRKEMHRLMQHPIRGKLLDCITPPEIGIGRSWRVMINPWTFYTVSVVFD